MVALSLSISTDSTTPACDAWPCISFIHAAMAPRADHTSSCGNGHQSAGESQSTGCTNVFRNRTIPSSPSERQWQLHSHPTEWLSEESDLNVAAKLPMNRRYNRDSIDRKADPRPLEIRYSVHHLRHNLSKSIVALT